jgi:hypothetical protein
MIEPSNRRYRTRPIDVRCSESTVPATRCGVVLFTLSLQCGLFGVPDCAERRPCRCISLPLPAVPNRVRRRSPPYVDDTAVAHYTARHTLLCRSRWVRPDVALTSGFR